MKIERIDTRLVELALPKPIGTAIHAIRSVGCVLVTLRTDQGVVGESFVFTINAARIASFESMIQGLGELVVGRDPHDTSGIWRDLWMEVNPTGHKGVTIAAMGAIDVACWDAVGRAAELPLHKLFGACRDTVDTYASSGLWMSADLDEIVAEATAFVEMGFTAIKLRIGSARPDDDVERVRVVREAIGRDVRLLVDINQKFTPKQAIRLGRRLEQFDLTWIEEPVAVHDLGGSAEVRAALDTPIASGETEFTAYGIKDMLDATRRRHPDARPAADRRLQRVPQGGGGRGRARHARLVTLLHRVQPRHGRFDRQLHLGRTRRLVRPAVQRTGRIAQRPTRDPQSPRHRLHLPLTSWELCQAQLPTDTASVFFDEIERGAALAGRSLADIDLTVAVGLEFTDDVEEADRRHADGYAFTFGAMGRPRGHRECGTTSLRVNPVGADLDARLAGLGQLIDLLDEIDAE